MILILIYCMIQVILACVRRIGAKAGGMFSVRTPTQVVDSQGNVYYLVPKTDRDLNEVVEISEGLTGSEICAAQI